MKSILKSISYSFSLLFFNMAVSQNDLPLTFSENFTWKDYSFIGTNNDNYYLKINEGKKTYAAIYSSDLKLLKNNPLT